VATSLQSEPDAADFSRRRPRRFVASKFAVLAVVLVVIFAGLAITFGPVAASQSTINGLVAGGYLGLGAIGLTLVLGILKLVNFAHGDLLVAGAYLTIFFGWLGFPPPAAMLCSMVATALLALATDRLIWRPLRNAGAGTLQLFLSAIGLALVLRFSIQFLAGSQVRTLGADVVASIVIGPLRLGLLQAVALVVGLVAMTMVGLGLRFTNIGKEMRAFADNRALAEVSGIDTRRIIDITWLASGFLAALAGILYATAIGSFNPNFGVTLLLSLFAATVLGGIGNAYGALVGGLVIGLSQEWSTLLFNARWKPAVGFALLILMLLFMPQGIFGRTKRRS
jgi:branched-subunit amino acid ABC-type transport system permease component